MKDWRIVDKTFTISDDAWSPIMRGSGCNEANQIHKTFTMSNASHSPTKGRGCRGANRFHLNAGIIHVIVLLLFFSSFFVHGQHSAIGSDRKPVGP